VIEVRDIIRRFAAFTARSHASSVVRSDEIVALELVRHSWNRDEAVARR